MNFEFSEDQNLLREQARNFLDGECPPTLVRAVLDGQKTGDSDLAKKIADMGFTATVVPEEHGGLGLSYYELCVIAEEMGRSVAPTSFSSSVYLATEALMLAGSPAQKAAWLPRLAKGDGASLVLVDLQGSGVSQSPLKMIDPTRTHSTVGFNGAAAELLGAEGQGWTLTQRLLDRAAVLFAWEQVGGAQAALEQAKEYAMGRYAFGRPIASYQAIKHKLANMYVKNTIARSNCYYGAWALATNADDLPLAAATARVGAIHAYEFASREDIQTHGGMGFTWEFDCQFHYRRSRLLSVNIGSLGQWQDKLINAAVTGDAA